MGPQFCGKARYLQDVITGWHGCGTLKRDGDGRVGHRALLPSSAHVCCLKFIRIL